MLLILTVAVGLGLIAGAVRLTDARATLLRAHNDVEEARDSALAGRYREASAALTRADAGLRQARSDTDGLPFDAISFVPVLGSPVKAVRTATSAAAEAVTAGRMVTRAATDMPTSGRSGINGHDLAPFHAAALRSVHEIEGADVHLARARQMLDGPAGALLPQVSEPAIRLARDAGSSRAQLAIARGAAALIGELTASDADFRLLVLSQDPMELRPTGGFVGSYGILRFNHGTAHLEEYDSFESLPAPNPPMTPPADLAESLDRPWDLSNVNWWPNFPTSAAAAREMFRRQTGTTVDGVLAVNYQTLARLLGAFGPIQVPGYTRPVGEQGFADRVLYEVELKRPFDSPRKKFLIRLSRLVFDRLFNLPRAKVPKAVDALDRSFAAGDLQVWFASPDRQQRVARLGVDGALPRTKGDFLMLTDANLTASKANRDLVKDATYRVTRTESGQLVASLVVKVENRGVETAINPYYNGFLRVYVPRGAQLLGGPSPARDDGVAKDAPYRVFSRPLYVLPGESETATFEYALPDEVAADGRYSLTWVRQAGTPADTLTADVGGREFVADPANRVLRADADFDSGPGGLRGILHDRWLTRQLGL